MNNISVFNPNNRPKVAKWLKNVANCKNANAYNRLSAEYETVRDMINKNGPHNTMGKVNTAFANLTHKIKHSKNSKNSKKNKTNKNKRNTMRQ